MGTRRNLIIAGVVVIAFLLACALIAFNTPISGT